jgi:PAS domain S-box-containing protein
MSAKEGSKKRKKSTTGIDPFRLDFVTAYNSLLHSAGITEAEKEDWKRAFEELNDIYNLSPCGIHSLDNKGRIIKINDTELGWLGYSRAELTGKSFRQFLCPKSQLIFDTSFPEFIEKGKIENLELELLGRNGLKKAISVSASAICDDKGNFLMSRSILYDISFRKQMEANLLDKNRELKELNEKISSLQSERDYFLNLFMHNLQHPLASISLLSEALLRKDEKMVESGQEIVQLMHEAAMQMSELVQNFLNAERMGLGNVLVHFSSFDLSRLCHNIIRRYQVVASHKQIAIQFEGPDSLLINTDKEIMTQILENLLSNAIKYSHSNTQVTVTINNGDALSISVQDQGIGIPTDEIPLLFKRFRPLSSRPTGGEPSTGLGLSIVHYLCQLLNGKIRVNSEAGKGSRFTLEFPADS